MPRPKPPEPYHMVMVRLPVSAYTALKQLVETEGRLTLSEELRRLALQHLAAWKEGQHEKGQQRLPLL